MLLDRSRFHIKIAETEAELAAAQRLRYRVFVEEMGARPGVEDAKAGLERDRFDPFYDHLILVDRTIADDRQNVVGVYRIMRGEKVSPEAGFYCAGEYDLSPLVTSGRPIAELGRSCVDAAHRGGAVLHLLWRGLADYVAENNIEILFGVASFPGVDPAEHADGLSWLAARYLAPKPLRVSALSAGGHPLAMKAEHEIDKLQAVRQIPPLLKSYLGMGGWVGEGAYVDREFNTVDVCLIMDMNQIPAHRKGAYQERVLA